MKSNLRDIREKSGGAFLHDVLNPEPDFEVLDQTLHESDKVFPFPDVAWHGLVQHVFRQNRIGQINCIVTLLSAKKLQVIMWYVALR